MIGPATAFLLLALVPEGIPCRPGAVATAEDGTFRGCRLATAATVGGVALPAGSYVELKPDRSLKFVFLPGDTELQGHVCRGEGHDWMTTFHPDGRLKLCWLARDETIDGVPCARATFWREMFGGARMTFHPDGTLESCRLAEDAVVDGRSHEGGGRVTRAARGSR